ncbi:MAG: hypothetical protein RR405_00665, partial [Clostridia bacterium]
TSVLGVGGYSYDTIVQGNGKKQRVSKNFRDKKDFCKRKMVIFLRSEICPKEFTRKCMEQPKDKTFQR